MNLAVGSTAAKIGCGGSSAHEKTWQQKPGDIFEYARLMEEEGITA